MRQNCSLSKSTSKSYDEYGRINLWSKRMPQWQHGRMKVWSADEGVVSWMTEWKDEGVKLEELQFGKSAESQNHRMVAWRCEVNRMAEWWNEAAKLAEWQNCRMKVRS